ncbi:MAG: Protein of unknown function (DUF1553)/Protein of unknown function (DUF1549)/Planctomycete [Verrucomicrobiales bacterium]|nr:Protein of unknown function (DUF1553)/Protein of unknown function (DUF1549)/Planctomycete [Verrucomicrobiales bacterium]
MATSPSFCRPANLFVAAVFLGLSWVSSGEAALPPSEGVAEGLAFFENKIRPVFSEHCYSCHSAGAKKVRGALKLDTQEDFLKGGTDGPVVVPGQPDQSRLIRAVRYADKDLEMPPNKDGGKKLSEAEIADLVRWVKLGAPYPASTASRKIAAARPWSFEPVQDPPPPRVKHTSWSSTSVDPFILARLEARGFEPAAPAGKRTLLRRATFDLTGLPPTPEEIDAFLADHSTNAFSKVVERLLDSPRYGERWGRHWLDIVRYADTAGDTADYPVGLAWRYRNYVIDAFNADKPYDEFIREQIAGDILAEQGPRARYAERVTATGFIAISRRFGFDSENYHHLTIQDTIDTVGQTTLGLSLGCARCHDHKFDPVTMKDYYGLYGIFDSTRYAFPGSEQKGKLRAMVPLVPPAESQSKWREYDRRVAELSDRITRQKQPVPSAVFRSLHDPDGDFEIQKDAAGGSYGVIVPPWAAEGKLSVTTGAQSPFKNLYPSGRFGVRIAGGNQEYRLAQALYPKRSPQTCRLLYVNLDFRPGPPENGATGTHRFWIGASSNSPAVELLLSTEAVFNRVGDQVEKLAGLKRHQWHNLQLILDLERRTFSGSVGLPESSVTFSNKPFVAGWSGVIDYVQLDSRQRGGAALPSLELDNFGAQPAIISPVSTRLPALTLAPGEPDPEVITAELQKLVGLDGDLEWQTDGAPPAKPWNPGPNSAVKVSSSAQSPFRNIVPAGKLGVRMPNRGGYDGLGLTLPNPWSAARTDVLFVAFDFRCGNQDAGGDGSWRYYLGHGGGGLAAVELNFNGSEFFTRSGATYDSVARLRTGEWHQVQLTLNLTDKTYTGTLSTPGGSTPFRGTFATSWDGTIDYTFIDSGGHRPGVRPALEIDNFVFQESPFPPLTAPALAESDAERNSRRARVATLRKQLTTTGGDVAKNTRELTSLLLDGPCEMTYGVVEGTPHNARLQMRGEPDRPGEEAPRGFLKILGGNPLPPATQGSGRLELAQWLTRADNPLTARVLVNRLWQYHFGRGLVGTPNDFGVRGQLPTHPELLDHLATRFMKSGWSIKAMHRLIMLSAAYQQSSTPALTVDGNHSADAPLAADYACFEPRRLSAEELRDAILAISGELDPTPGHGHPFPSPVTTAYSQHAPFSAVYDHNQRSVYLMTQRIKRHPFLALFDGSDPNASTADRRTTTVPTQALYFLNSPFVHEKADKFATRLQAARPDDRQRVELGWRKTIGRTPTETERLEAAEFLTAYRSELSAAGQSNPDHAALAAYLRSLFGSNEFLHLD